MLHLSYLFWKEGLTLWLQTVMHLIQQKNRQMTSDEETTREREMLLKFGNDLR